MLILSTRPQEVNFKDFSKEPMLKAQRMEMEDIIEEQENVITKMAKIIKISTDYI